ncbi:MAG: c-type cytochrome [Actinomycetota bacterium]
MSDLMFTATEAADASSGLSGGTIAMVILLAALAVFAIAYYVVGPGRRRGPKVRGDIPLAMRPYHSDEELETTGLERAMAWGVALSVFMAVFLPLYWLIEPSRIDDKIDEFYDEEVAFGRQLFADNCTTCHGSNAKGGFAPHPDPEIDAPWPAPALDNVVARYEDSEIVTDVEHFVQSTIEQGRPGTPMPAWSSAFQGPMNDQQIEAITAYLLSIQTGETEEPDAQAFRGASGEDVFTQNCARCHAYDATGRVGPSLIGVFDRYGAEPDDESSVEMATAAVRDTILAGRYVPAGTPMPSFEAVLTEDAIDQLIEYLKSIQQPPLQ